MNAIRKILKASFCASLTATSFTYAEDDKFNVSTSLELADISKRDSLFLSNLTEDILKQTGFTPSITWTGEVWADISRSDIDTIFDSLFTFGFSQDLSTAFGSNRLGDIGVSAFYYNRSKGGRLNDFSSSQGDFSNILAGDMARVYEFFYTNSFESDYGEVAFRVGQLAADEDFMGLDFSDIFLNSSFGAIPNVAPAQLFSQYNVATLGLVVYYNYEKFNATFGVFNGNVAEDVSSNNGFDFSNIFDTVALWLQLGYDYQISELQGSFIVGGNYHSSPSDTNFDTIAGARNFYSFYLAVQQVLVNNSDSDALLGVFARFGIVPESSVSDNNFYADFGFNWFAPIPSRKADVFAAAVSVIENERSSREEFSHYETTLELSYKMQLTSAITFQPDMQIFFNPALQNGDSQTAYIVGARVDVIF